MPNSQTRRVNLLTGGLIGLMVTAPLIAVLFVGGQMMMLPLPFFELFDRIARILPGDLITRGIDAMIAIFSRLPGVSTDVASKAAEQSLAVILFLVLGALFGALTAYVLSRAPKSIPGAYVGASVALIPLILTLLIERFNSGNANGLAVASSWILLAYVIWGMIVGVVLERLSTFRQTTTEVVPTPANPARRAFMGQFSGAVIVVTLGAWGVGRLSGSGATVGSAGQAIATGPTPTSVPAGQETGFVVVPGTRLEVTPNNQFYRVDINTAPPNVNEKTWKLTVAGSVDKAYQLSYDEMLKLTPTEMDATLECISNPVGGGLISSTHWIGVKLRDVLNTAQVRKSAVEIRFTCADGYTETLPIASAMDERTLLAYATNGEKLAAVHGFPLRLYVPDRYGMKNPKWITSIEAIDAVENGYWTDRGWVKDAFVKHTSVIDVVATDQIKNDLVPVGGIAFGGARGISKVELSVDGGTWQAAQLKDPISPLTWRFWRLDVALPKGHHTITVRSVDGEGKAQIQEEAPLHPSGASGYVTKDLNIA